MPVTLENAALYLSLDPQRNLFSVHPRQANAPAIENAHFSIQYRIGPRRHLQERILPAGVSEASTRPSPLGELRGLDVRYGPNRHGLTIDLRFAAPREHPFLLWNMTVRNGGKRPVQLGRLEMLRVGFAPVSQADPRRSARHYPRGEYVFPLPDASPAFFTNGWGSWNYSGALGYHQTFPRTRFRWFNGPIRINPGTPQPRGAGHFASDMFGVLGDRTHRGGLLLGFLSQKQHFGSLEVLTSPLSPALSLWANGDGAVLQPGESLQTDWACLQPLHLDSPDPMGPYLQAVMRVHDLQEKAPSGSPVGWCSWYQYFQDIRAPVILDNLERAARFTQHVDLDLIQIDDGWQAQVGDWDAFAAGFPDGPAPLANEIRARGMTPGLWLAPFILHPQSETAHSHPEWLLRGRLGLPVNAGFVWNAFTRALDLSVPAALDHAVESVRRAAQDWGYPYLKLDFLYAGALAGRRADRSRTRAQILRQALERVRSAVGEETTLLGCGCPLGSAVGLFDAMRINADVAPHWFPRFKGHERLLRSEPDFPSARNAIQNALTRAPLHRRWWVNDPDCLLLRSGSDLTLDEVRSLATVITLGGGSLLISDDLTALPPDRLQIAARLLPLIGKRPQVVDWFDSSMPAKLRLDLSGPAGDWHLLAAFNWSEAPLAAPLDVRDFLVDPAAVGWARSFWTGELIRGEEGVFAVPPIAPHGCVLLAVRPHRAGPQYLGSDLHISQGMEVAEWGVEPGRLSIALERPGEAEGVIVLKLPGPPVGTGLNKVAEGVYEIPVAFRGKWEGEIRFEKR